MPPRDRILEYFYTCATKRLPMDNTRRMLEETFLWGCQATQRMQGIGTKSPKFIVGVGLILSRRGKSVLGWRLTFNDGTTDALLYKDRTLNPVNKNGSKRRKFAQSKGAKPTLAPAHSANVPCRQPATSEIEAALGDAPANGPQFASFMSRAGKIVRDILPKTGIKEVECARLVKDWLLRRSGKEKINKIGALQFEELVSKMEALADAPEELVQMLKVE